MPETLWLARDVGDTEDSKKLLLEIFSDGEEINFHAPKPHTLIQRVLSIATTSQSVILLLTGESLPDYASIGAWLFHTATGEPLDLTGIREDQSYLGESSASHVWLIYQPELDFLKSRDVALTLSFAEKISRQKDKRHLVFAPARFAPNKMLLPPDL